MKKNMKNSISLICWVIVLLQSTLTQGGQGPTPFAFGAAALPDTGNVKVYPTNWWVGMKNPDLRLMIHGTAVGKAPSVQLSYPGIQLIKVRPADNPNYLFLDLRI